MATIESLAARPGDPDNLANVIRRLGDIPLERIPFPSPLGRASEADVLAALEGRTGPKRLYELFDGVLVEKPMGYFESWLGFMLCGLLGEYLREHPVGIGLSADGALRVLPGQVRIPDVCFISWERMPGGALPPEPIPDLVPDLAVEILSQTNTRVEMERKLADYFEAGTLLVWIVDPPTRSARAYTSPGRWVDVGPDGWLEGDPVLPGFRVSMADWFARATAPGQPR